MVRYTALSLLALWIFPFAAFASSPAQAIDGDTLVLAAHDKPIRIQLAHVDAPELDQPHGDGSRASLAELCAGKEVAYQPVSAGLNGATVAIVTCGGVDVAREQVKRGMAWVDPAQPYSRVSAAIQEEAWTMRRGLWAESDPVPPWEWRAQRGKSGKK